MLPHLKVVRQHAFLEVSKEDFTRQFKKEFVALCSYTSKIRSAPEHSPLTIHLDVLFEDYSPDTDNQMYNHRDNVSANTDKLLREALGPRGVQSGAGAACQNVRVTTAEVYTGFTECNLYLVERGLPTYT